MRKVWKIGEYAKGGIIEAQIHDEDITLRCKDWDTKEIIFEETSDDEVYLLNVLFAWTSYYYADKIINWIKDNQKMRII